MYIKQYSIYFEQRNSELLFTVQFRTANKSNNVQQTLNLLFSWQPGQSLLPAIRIQSAMILNNLQQVLRLRYNGLLIHCTPEGVPLHVRRGH